MTIYDETYYGTLGNDFWQLSLDTPVGYGRAGNDYLIGYGGGTEPEFDFDYLQGGTGADTFVLGESFAFYTSPATDENATIVDFSREEGDKLQVFGSISDYSLEEYPAGVYVNYQGNLIAAVQNVTDLSLQLDFNFV